MFTLSIAEGITQQGSNATYPKQSEIHSLQELLQAVQFDHVAGIFKNNHRSNSDFIQADCFIMDCDNYSTDHHTDDSAMWLTPEKLSERLQGVPFFVVYSRNHMKQKGDISPRPRFHVYFPLSHIINDAEQIRTLKEILLDVVPEFDEGAKDAARFIYGVHNPEGVAVEGDTCIDTYLAGVYADLFTAQNSTARDDDDELHSMGLIEHAIQRSEHKPYFDFISNPDRIIPEGKRHSTRLSIAVGALMNEDYDSALATYEKACRQCRPPCDKKDSDRIWQDALEYVVQQRGQAGRKRKSTPLSLPIISDFLNKNTITVQFDVIKKTMNVSGFEDNDPALPPEYTSLSDTDKRKLAPALLPLVISPIFRRNHFLFSEKFLTDCIEQIAAMHKYNPVKAMLDATTWDGQDRIKMLIEALGISYKNNGTAEEWNTADYYSTCLRKWLHQTIALPLNDEGTYKPDFVLTLQGRQGIGKTNFFRALAIRPEWFREGATIDTRDKDTIIQATNVWICELGELDATLSKEQSDLKSFLTRTHDTYRRPYARTEDTVERRTSFCATVNPQEINRDITGSRRFVYINVDGMDKQFIFQTMTPEWVAQLWRQVYEKLYLPDPEGYFLTDEELQRTELNNKPYRMPIKAETELRDLIAWELIGTYDADNDNEPFSDFVEYTATDVKKAYKSTLSRYDSRLIGKALKLLCDEYRPLDITGYGATYRTEHGRAVFTIPRIKNREDEDTSTRPSRYNGWQ